MFVYKTAFKAGFKAWVTFEGRVAPTPTTYTRKAGWLDGYDTAAKLNESGGERPVCADWEEAWANSGLPA